MSTAESMPLGRRLRRSLVRIVGVVAAFVVGLWITACAAQDTMIFPGHKFPPPAPGPPVAEPITHWLDLDDGQRVESWLYLPKGATAAQPAPVVIFFHGNGEVIDLQHAILDGYLRRGVAVFLPEYRGYGRSGGKPGQKAIGDDMRIFLDWLIAQPGVDHARVIYHGRSLGGGVACDLARDRTPAAMVLESTFTSINAMAARMLVPSFFVRHPFRNDRVIADADYPLLIMHGTRDTSIPVAHARRNRDLATRSPRLLYAEFDCNHNDVPTADDHARYWQLIDDLIASIR